MTDKKLISSLQGLRAVAFLCVVISHCGAPWLGPWAISVFVALSGFLMVCNYYDRPRTAPGLQSAIAFSFKKIRRLYPLHLIMMAAALLFVLKGLLAQPSARGVLSCAAQLAVSIFLLQTWIPSPYGFLIHQVLIRYMEWTADKFSLTVQPVVWTLTVFLLTLCLSWFYKALERRVRQRRTKATAQ